MEDVSFSALILLVGWQKPSSL